MTTNPFYRTERKQIYIPSRSGQLGRGTWIDEPDPFGRVLEPSGEARLDISDPFALSGPVGRRGGNAREDVGRVECLLKLAGVHDLAPTDGPTGYFGTRLEEAVKAFQKDHGLRTDGEVTPGGETLKALAQTLQGMGRHGDTVLAHLTPGEAQFLHEITDVGSFNPMTGLVEFWFGFGGEDTNAGSYEGAVSAAAGDESLSDADFWGGYETATAAFDRSNSGGGDGGGAEAPAANSSSPLSGKTTPPAPPTTPARTYDDEITRRQRLNTIEARRRERNKPNLLEETPRVTDNRTLEDDDQHLNFVDPLPDPTDSNRKETQEPVNSKRQIRNIFEYHRKLEEERRREGKLKDLSVLRQERKNQAPVDDSRVTNPHLNIYDDAIIRWARKNKTLAYDPRQIEKYLDKPEIPASKKQLINDREWDRFFNALTRLPGITQKEIDAFMSIFGLEGGLRSPNDSSTFAGITRKTLNNLIEGGYVMGIGKGRKPASLSTDEVARVYRAYFDEVFKAKTLGPSQAISIVKDPLAATTLWDALFSHGTIPAGLAVQHAINTVKPETIENPKGVVGSTTLKEFDKLTSDPKTRDKTLNALANARIEHVLSNPKISTDEELGYWDRITSLLP